jgi:hypothetical protein
MGKKMVGYRLGNQGGGGGAGSVQISLVALQVKVLTEGARTVLCYSCI